MSQLLTVHDPRGYAPKVTGKRLAARPESLDGKTLYLVDCLFDNSEAFMDAAARLVRQASSGGNGLKRSNRARAGSTIRRCGRSSRTVATRPFSASGFEAPVAPRSWGSRWRSREAGVPAVAVHTNVFARLAQSTARAAGMPRTRQCFVPQPVVDIPPEQLRSYIEGVDPVSKQAVHARRDRRLDGTADRMKISPDNRSNA